MAVHILLMNAVGPAIAAAALGWTRRSGTSNPGLALPCITQILVLWAWHAPPMVEYGVSGGHLLMSGSLLGVATWYWFEIFRTSPQRRWKAIASLLLTSKLFCLLGVLYVFAPRVLYPGMTHHNAMDHASSGLGDQQLAGLLMLAACPVTYLLAGVWISVRWLFDLERAEATRGESEIGALRDY